MDAQPLFGAPSVAAAPSVGGGAVETTLALLLILGVIAVLAWFARRMRAGAFGRSSRIQVLATQPLGVKESAVLVRVGETQILVGVAPGSVRALHVFAPGADTEAPPAAVSSPIQAPNFKDLLLKSLGRKP